MKPLVVDASALIEYLLRTPRALPLIPLIESRNHQLHVPALADVEIASVLGRLLLRGTLDDARAAEALDDWFDLPLERHGHLSLLPRVVSLRQNFTAYDAVYVTLAEQLGAAVLTADGRLARAIRAHLDIELA